MNPFQKLFLVCDSADQFIESSKDPNLQEETIQFSILGCLLSIEEALDKGRISAAAAENAVNEDKLLVNKRMDQIRGEIADLLKKLASQFGKERVTDYLQSRARNISTNWVNTF